MLTRAPILILSFAVLFISSLSVQADRPSASNLLPEDTLAYVRVADTNVYGQKFDETSMGKLLKDPQMAPFLTGVWSTITESAAQIEEEVGITIEELLSIPNGEIAFAVVPQEDGPIALVLFIDLGDNPKTAEKAMDVLREYAIVNGAAIENSTYKESKITKIDGQRGPLAYVIKDKTLTLSTQVSMLENILEHWETPRESSLNDNEKFTTIISSSRGTKDEPAHFTWYVDPIALTRKAFENAPGSNYFIAFLPVLGLDGIQAAGGSIIMATEDFDTISHLHIMMERPRSGVLDMVAPKNTNPIPDDWVPADVTTYMTLDWDIEQTYDSAEKLYDSVAGDGSLASAVDRRLNQTLGINFEEEVIENLEGRITMVQWYEPPARINSQATMLAFRLNDAKAFKKTIETILDTVPSARENLEEKNFATFKYYQTVMRNRELPDDIDEDRRRRIERARALRPQPCFAVVGDYLFATDRPGLMEHVMKSKRDVVDRLADDLSFKLMLSKLQKQAGERNIGMLSFTKPEQALRMWYDMAHADSTKQMLTQQAENNPFFQSLKTNMEANPLPPFSVISSYMAPSGSILIDDETGVHIMGFSLKRTQGE